MYAERLILETDNSGNLKKLPKLPPNKQLEVIFLELDDALKNRIKRRRPHQDIIGQTRILGDIVNTVSETDWDLPR